MNKGAFMRFPSRLKLLIPLTLLAAPAGFSQINPANLTITGYQMISEQRVTRTQSYFSYRADVVNAGPSLPAITATVTSLTPSAVVVPGQGNLHFPAVPSKTEISSINTFTLLIDKSVSFNLSSLKWSFNAPVADAGPAQTVTLGSTVHLTSAASSNPSGLGTLTYAWGFQTVPAGSTATIQNPTSVTPTFVADVAGDYIVSVSVSNGVGTDSSFVKITTTNSGPVADAGPNQSVVAGTTVHLDGSRSSDADGDPITYSWSLVQVPPGSQAVLSGANLVNPTFVADFTGIYIARLVISDGTNISAPSFVTITTGPGHTRPVAIATTATASVSLNATVQLDGSKSTDIDGNPLTYKWSLITIPAGSHAALSSLTLVNPTFIADTAGTYVAQLIVNDGFNDSLPATVTVSTTGVQPPVANPGPNQSVVHGATVTLNGSGTDPQGLPLTFKWALIGVPPGSTAQLSNINVPNPTFVADLPGTYVAQLTVNNGVLNSPTANVTITTTNAAPVAVISVPSTTVPVGATVALSGLNSTDAEHDPLTYKWTLLNVPAGSSAVLVGATTSSPTFIADVAGPYVVQLIVNDGFVDSQPVTVTITASTGATITLSPDPLNLTNAPGTLTVTLGNPAKPGGQVINLAILDTTVATTPSSVTVAEGQTTATVSITPVALGSTIILASATGLSNGSAHINVGASSLTLSLSASTVGISKSVTATVTLSSPAPTNLTGSITVNNTNIVNVPSTFTIAAGSTTATFTVTGQATGTTNITAVVPGYGPGDTRTITVTSLGAISLQSGAVIGVGQTVNFGVTLITPAPVGGVTVNLVSSDPRLTVTPSVFIKEGATAPDVSAQITGVNIGTANITASATGFAGDTKSVQVAANLSFQPGNITLAVGASQTLTLTLSGPAPVGGITVTLQSNNNAVAAVPSSVNIAQGATTAAVPVTAGSTTGSAIITASSSVAGIVSGTANVTVVSGLAISAPLPPGVVGAPYNATVTATGGTPPYTFTATNLPAGLSISAAGVITGTPTAAGSSTPTITVTDTTPGTHLTATATPTIVISPALAINPITLPTGVVGSAYSATVTATGGNAPYTFTATGLPAGLSITSGGQITGTPTAAGPATIVVTATDSTSPTKLTATASLPITISGAVAITTTSLPNGTVGTGYNFTVAATGGTAPYTFTASGLPAGLSISPAGVISGTPTANGTASVTLTVTDSTNPTHATSSVTLPLTISNQLAVSTTSLPSGVVGAAYNFTVTATGGVAPYTFTAAGLPAGLSISAGGVISGTPTTAGAPSVAITVTDSTNPTHLSATVNLTLTIGPGLAITPLTAPNGTVNVAYPATQVSATGGTAPYTFTATGLPAGLSISAGGSITGTPTAAGSFTAVITATDSTNPTHLTATLNLPITIAPPQLAITTTSLPGGTVGAAYNATVAATGGTTPYTFTATGLPAGLSISAAGVISGTPTAPGTVTAAITVTDSTNPTHMTATANLSIAIAPQNPSITTTSLPNGTVGSPYNATITGTGGTTPYTFTATGLPAGLSISAGGVISGTPTVAGPFSIVVTLTDSTNPTHLTATANLSATIAPQTLAITTSSLPSGTVGAGYSAQVQATGGTLPYTFTASGLPGGLSITTGGQITGTPTLAGSYPVAITVTDSTNPTHLTATANLTIVISGVSGGPGLTISGATVGQNLQAPLIINLSQVPSTSVNVTISSDNPNVVLAGRAVDAGTTNLVIAVQAGVAQFNVYAQGLASSGTANITASGAGYNSGTSQVTLAPSGFVLAGPNGVGGSFTSNQGAITPLTVSAVQLDGSGNVGSVEQVRGGFSASVNLSVANSAVGTVSPATANFTGGVDTASAQFTAGNTATSSTITAVPPAGFSTPAGNANVVAVTVQPVSVIAGNASVGQDLETTTQVTIQGTAPADTVVTLTSADPSRLLLSNTPTATGSASITVTLRSGFSSTPPFYVYGVGNSGTVQYTASVPGFGTGNGTITLGRSAVLLSGPAGTGNDFTTTTGSSDSFLNVSTALIDGPGAPIAQNVAGGFSVSVAVTSSNTAVGTITVSPLTIGAGNNSNTTQFHAISSGTTTLSAAGSAPFVIPSTGGSLVATVSTPKILVSADSVGKGLEQQGSVFLAAAAPAGGVNVTLTVTSGAASLSATGTDAGSASITINIPAGNFVGSYFVYGNDVAGTATIQATAPGYASGTTTVSLVPSGVVIGGTFGLGSGVSTTVGGADQTLSISTAKLDPAEGIVIQALKGGSSLTVNLTNSTPSVGSVPGSVTIAAGTDTKTANFHPLASGTTFIGVVQPAGFSTPAQYTQLQANVQ